MQYTKAMIDLVFQIRKSAPEELRSNIKLSNPELLGFLADSYLKLEELRLRSLIQQLLALAGPAWSALVSDTYGSDKRFDRRETSAPSPSAKQKLYRGQSSGSDEFAEPVARVEKVITYRGQQITVSH